MVYQLTYSEFTSIFLESNEQNIITSQKDKMEKLKCLYKDEKDPEKKKKLQMEIKVCELKIMIANIK